MSRGPERGEGRRPGSCTLQRSVAFGILPAREPGSPWRQFRLPAPFRLSGLSLTWRDLSDNLWNNAVHDTREMAVGGNNALYVAMNGGVFVLDSPAVPG